MWTTSLELGFCAYNDVQLELACDKRRAFSTLLSMN
jgi:hypothetical protein